MKTETRSFYERVVQRALERIASSLDEALELDALAVSSGLSPFHFHRIFRGMVGETAVELSRRLRLERAAWRLVHGEQGVTAIAFDAGYETHEGFTRAFRAAYVTSPSGFRQRRYPRIQLAASCGIHFDAAGIVPAFTPRTHEGEAMNVEVLQRPELRVASVRHVGPYNQITAAFERLGELVTKSRLTPEPGGLIAIFHDDPDSAPSAELRSDAGIVIPSDVSMPPELTEQRLPAGRYARTTHIGPYELLGDAWARFIGEWLPSSGHELGPGLSYEMYRNTPVEVPRDELHTDLYLPLAPERH